MPRIDPIQLLNCLSVLLSPSGGIKSRDEVQRLASLMTKFSKKLVSKCIYVQILKCTETDLLGLFMGSGGWLLVHMWLTESIVTKNWPLVHELLELLLLCPVDIERLKTNNCPKLVKELSKDGNHFAIRALASKLVEQWLKTVKGEQVVPVQIEELSKIVNDASKEIQSDVAVKEENIVMKVEVMAVNDNESKGPESSIEPTDANDSITEKDVADTKIDEDDKVPVLKISLKDGKQVLSQVEDNENKNSEGSDNEKEHNKSKSKEKSKERSSSNSSSNSKSSNTSSRHSTKRHSSSSSSDKNKSSHRSSSSSRHSSKEGSKDKHSTSRSKSDSKSSKSSDRSSSSSSRSKEERKSLSDKDKKEKGKDEKSKENLQKGLTEKVVDDKAPPTPPSIHKLGKIPKLIDVKRDKPSISIEVRKPDEPKPKTVKTFHSKFRKHGLEEEIKPPPSRAAVLNKKPPHIVPPPSVPIPKRPSPVHNETPPEKKIKIIEPVEKPGAIKLIPPKPKPMMLLESDMFMDALNASATNKKEPKKRKRRTSGSKDGNAPNDGSPPHTPTATSPSSESKSVPPRFYQDTLETDDKEKSEKITDSVENVEAEPVKEKADEITEPVVPHTLTINGLKGVLCYHKKKGPKKSIRWKPEAELEEIQYFELDETERVNVTKNFTDMKHLDRIKEREAFQMSRNLSSDDVMEEKTSWRPLVPLDEVLPKVEYGKNSKERDIQAIRQKGTLQPLYFNKAMIPDSPLEPEPETHPYTEPTTIPLEDVTSDNISDFRNMPWPEPKGNAPPVTNLSMPAMFPNNMMQVPNGFPNPQFPGVQMVPGFQGPNMVPGGDWPNGMPPPQMMNPMTTGVLAPGAIPPGAMPPGMMMPTENMMMGPEMFGAPNPMFPMPPEGFNMPQNMFPMDFNMAGPQGGPPGPDNFNGPGNFRGGVRGRGGGNGHWRGKGGGGNWDNNQRGRGGARGNRKAVCIYFQRKGSCRQGDNCSFLHLGANGPY